MKTPLSFQLTEYDCGTTSLINALRYLFDREEISITLLKEIYAYTLDKGKHGTSRDAIKNINYHINKNIAVEMPIVSNYYSGKDIDLNIIYKCLKDKGVILVRTFLDTEHYAIITDADNENIYFFDPYYVDESFFDNDDSIENDFNHLFSYNRVVKISRFSSSNKEDFALGPIENRECLCIYRKSLN